jgi:hypothetical protein
MRFAGTLQGNTAPRGRQARGACAARSFLFLESGMQSMNKKSAMWRGAAVVALTASALTLAACGKKQEAPQAGKPQVTVVTLTTQPVS